MVYLQLPTIQINTAPSTQSQNNLPIQNATVLRGEILGFKRVDLKSE